MAKDSRSTQQKRIDSEEATIIPGPPSPALARQIRARQIVQGVNEDDLLESPYPADQQSEKE